MNANDCNNFRAEYDSLSFDGMQDWYERMRVDHPQQSHFDKDKVARFFVDIPADVRVLELGGWDGELASHCIDQFWVSSWVNYEICKLPTVCKDRRYSQPPMTDFLWEMPVDFSKFNVFIASHILEHLSDKHLHAMFNRIPHIRHVYVDMPPETTHHDTTAFHVLEDSWVKVNRLLESR